MPEHLFLPFFTKERKCVCRSAWLEACPLEAVSPNAWGCVRACVWVLPFPLSLSSENLCLRGVTDWRGLSLSLFFHQGTTFSPFSLAGLLFLGPRLFGLEPQGEGREGSREGPDISEGKRTWGHFGYEERARACACVRARAQGEGEGKGWIPRELLLCCLRKKLGITMWTRSRTQSSASKWTREPSVS